MVWGFEMAELFFGEFRFDTRRLELEGPDGPLETRPKTLQVLTYLISCRNRFVSKDELMSELWPDVRVTGASVTQCISELRGLLDDSAREPRYIETRVKNGYRFVATLYHKPTEVMEPLPPPPETTTERKPLRRKRRAFRLSGAVLAVLALVGSAYILSRKKAPEVLPVVVSSVTTGSLDESTSSFAEALGRDLRRELAEIEGISTAEGDQQKSKHLSVAMSTRRLPSGRQEVVAVLRRFPEGREIWGWTWVLPAAQDGVDLETREIVARIGDAVRRR